MRIPRTLAIAGIGSTLLLGSLAAPASAVSYPVKINIVQGIPGKTFEVCIGTNEVRSTAKYGSVTKVPVEPGVYMIKLKRPSSGKCKGQLYRKTTVAVAVNQDLTVVATRKSPSKWITYYNPQTTTVDTGLLSITHAADLGNVGISYLVSGLAPGESPYIWSKGERRLLPAVSAGTVASVVAMKVGHTRLLGGLRRQSFAPGKHYDYILLGTEGRNAKWARVVRSLVQFL